ncbi:uncharacterized protein LOC142639522 [Castanea sativa]|uniref:uncharacterized protein LOC142639522 n=1 Tax=Castanea sativa TaxID=21020 RepID=UPI003F64955B
MGIGGVGNQSISKTAVWISPGNNGDGKSSEVPFQFSAIGCTGMGTQARWEECGDSGNGYDGDQNKASTGDAMDQSEASTSDQPYSGEGVDFGYVGTAAIFTSREGEGKGVDGMRVRGTLKPNFQNHVGELARNHNPVILVVMETLVGGDRAREITSRLPFDGVIVADPIGYTGGIWLLWKLDRVEVVQLACTEKEIHVEVKVLPSNFSWIFTAMYASPRIVERQVLWENLSKVADLHSKPWIIAGDFNEPLVGEDKFEGSPDAANRDFSYNVQWQPKLSCEEKSSIDHMVTKEEIRADLWSLKVLKPPVQTGCMLTQGPESISSYRPISLCYSVYKIVSKILVGRIRPLLDHLISPCQAAFVPGRRGANNAIVMQEIIHTMGIAKGKGGYVALKIDLEKAYDKLKWSFIRGMLIIYNFPDNLIEIIMSCISSVSTSILFNGGSLETFRPSRGIRQGDPLSPCFRQTVSDSKSRVYFSPNIDHDDREAFSDFLGFRQTECLGNLGFPIKHQGNNSQDLGFVLDRVKCKLAGWKANLLSMAGRAAMVQASSSTIPAYIMQCNLPGKVLDGIDRGPLSKEAENLKIKDVVDYNGQWDWSVIQMSFLEEIFRDIKATPIPFFARLEDRLAWKYSAKSDFELKRAYRLTTKSLGAAPFNGKWIWKLKALPKIQNFFWKCMHQSIGVKQCLVARGLQANDYCPRCHVGVESILHMLRDCPLSKILWQQLRRWVDSSNFFTLSLQDWREPMPHLMLITKRVPCLGVTFSYSIFGFFGKIGTFVSSTINIQIPIWARTLWTMLRKFFFFCAKSGLVTKRSILKSIRWVKPRAGWLTLNIDGSATSNSSPVGGGGLIRDENGGWVIGFARRIGSTSSLMAELWVLRDGL